MERISRHKKIFFTLAVVLCFVIIVLTVLFRTNPTVVESTFGYVVVPMQRAATTAGQWVSGKIEFFVQLNTLEETNKRLEQQVDALQTENTRLRLMAQENAKLSALLEIGQKYADFPKTGAEVIAKDMGNWYDKFTIDKGTKQGIDKNMAVIASGGLVGITVESGATYSRVISMIDSTSAISAKSTRTGDTGTVMGDLDLMDEGLCRMELIDLAAEISVGDEIVTSQLSDFYPPGITIGTVEEVGLDENGLTKYAIIAPAVDFKHLETVYVITSKS